MTNEAETVEVAELTPEMQVAWAEYEAPYELQANMPLPRVLSVVRHAFFAGWLARLSTHKGTGDVERLKQRVRELEGLNHDTHTLFKDGDADAPAGIKDRNGDIVLGACKVCRAGEAELYERPCAALSTTRAPDADEVERASRLRKEVRRLREEANMDDRAATISENPHSASAHKAVANAKREFADDIEALASLYRATVDVEPKVIRRTTMVELLAAIYDHHGWKRAEGESRANRAQAIYEITADASNNRYVATPRLSTPAPMPTGERERIRAKAWQAADDVSERICSGRYRASLSDVETLRNHVRLLAALIPTQSSEAEKGEGK